MCAAAVREFEQFIEEENGAIEAILGANPFVGLDARQTLEMLARMAGAWSTRLEQAGTARALELEAGSTSRDAAAPRAWPR